MQEPLRPEKLSIDLQRKIDLLCDDVESQWRRGQTPDIAELAAQFDGSSVRDFLSEIIRLDRELHGGSDSALREKYASELPEHKDIVDSILTRPAPDRSVCHEVGSTIHMVGSGDESINDAFVGNSIGDYKIEKRIAVGGFGVVYLARNAYLSRPVVVKIPRLGSLGRGCNTEEFLEEARKVSMLDHQHILKVFHAGVEKFPGHDQEVPYIVQEYFEGGDLKNALDRSWYTVESTVPFMEKVARAVGFAHQHQIVHRDLKPSNILIHRNGDPVIADFGLALHEPQLRGRDGELAGTTRYMSPEQVRGEAHRLDGRSDIWSLGVILYLMLVRRHPFEGSDVSEICKSILFGRPYPPRQLNGKIGVELNRICQKCLSQRVSDRYSSAFDLADELNQVSNADRNRKSVPVVSDDVAAVERPTPVVPKGLVAFDEDDRDFFLQLLPGPLDRDGLPAAIHFWKSRIENPSNPHPVGLIYGPSGCGKSSLVSAGLLPRLADEILVVRVDSTAEDTEVRLLKGLRSQLPAIPQDCSLPEAISGIRRGLWLSADRRVLIVLDQFEQWLHANPIDGHTQLINALRHCDGQAVQSLILARDDFWMRISRFFRQLEIDLVEHQNFASVDLFTRRHAKDVLIKFGQAYGNLPESEEDFSENHREFLDEAIDLIAERDAVICVRLVLFAEIVRHQPWDIATLRRIGSSKNIGIVFLEQKLGEHAANPRFRFHRQSLLAVLESLLPDPGIEIKGNLRSRAELAQAAKMKSRDADFGNVLQILDNELRLITPAEPDSGVQKEHVGKDRESYYQLTHDYLVPSLREWLQDVQGRSRQGRAKLRLRSLAASWHATGDSRFLPGFFEYCSICLNVPRRSRDQVESRYLGQAHRLYSSRGLIFMLVATALATVLWQAALNRIRESTETRVAQLLTCAPESVPLVFDEFLAKDAGNAISILRSRLTSADSSRERNRILYGLGRLESLSEPEVMQLIAVVPEFDDAECPNLVAAMSHYRHVALPEITRQIQMQQWRRFRMGCLPYLVPSPEFCGAYNEQYWARLEILRMFLEPDSVSDFGFAYRADPTSRSTLVHRMREWHGDLELAPRILAAARADATVAGLCIGFGRINPQEFDGATLATLKKQILELYRSDSRSSVHGASRWVLTKWDVDFKDVLTPVDNPPADDDREWWVNRQALTMVRIQPGIVPNARRHLPTPDRVDREFFLSSCEITSRDFLKFVDDGDYENSMKPVGWKVNDAALSPDSAANSVTFEDALLFCNWLSWKNQRQPCYRRSGRKIKMSGPDTNWENWKTVRFVAALIGRPLAQSVWVDEWELIPGANGYRLPTHEEWELAARGNCVTDHYYASDPFFPGYQEYVWGTFNTTGGSGRFVQPVGLTIPNSNGLFDTLGNVVECCWGLPPGYRMEPGMTRGRGGSFDMGIKFCDFTNMWPRYRNTRKDRNGYEIRGFRIALDSD